MYSFLALNESDNSHS